MPKEFKFKPFRKPKFEISMEIPIKNNLRAQFQKKGLDLTTLPACLNQEERTKWMRKLGMLGE